MTNKPAASIETGQFLGSGTLKHSRKLGESQRGESWDAEEESLLK